MRRTILALSATLALGFAMGVTASRVLSAQGEGVRRTEILRTGPAGPEGREGHVWVVVIPAGQATGKHYHPGYESVYTMDGTGSWKRKGSRT
jgi:quercetin dioxygenase-like cupin family protein